MRRFDHALLSPSLGVQKTLTSLHYGTPGARPKVYIQASLHADELPGMLVAHHLRKLLDEADSKGGFLGAVVLVPVANPIGLARRVDHKHLGRFELGTSENFNRHYPDLAKAIAPTVMGELGPDAQSNVAHIREAISQFLQDWKADTELQSLRKTLLQLSFDADIVIDLHCDNEACMHLYTEDTCWPAIAPLAQQLQCEAALLAHNSGGSPFDECLSGVWWQLSQMAKGSHPGSPIPQACASTTIELRGEGDVTHSVAADDARAIVEFLQHSGSMVSVAPVTLRSPRCAATPLAGSETLTSSVAGLLVFLAEVGQKVNAGDLIAEVIDPINNTVLPIRAGVTGLLYARVRERYVTTGAEVGKIAGTVPFRTGTLLGA